MEINNEFDENQVNHEKMQEDLIKLIKVLDGCIEEMDKFYFYTRKKQMLACSTNN